MPPMTRLDDTGEGAQIYADLVTETRRRLTLRPPKDNSVAALMDLVRYALINTGELLESKLPPGRELSLALTKLEECCFWAVAAIARNQDVA